MKRVEIFSDGVLAIAITLLVVELPFDKVGHGELGKALGDHWPSFVAYAVSFLGVGILWLHHHALFGAIGTVDRPILLLNLLALLPAAFLPFPTALVGDYLEGGGEDAKIAVFLYSANWLAISAAMAVLCAHAVRHPRLLARDIPPDGPRRLFRNFRLATVMYVGFTALALLSPVACLACYAASAAYFLWRSDYRALGKPEQIE